MINLVYDRKASDVVRLKELRLKVKNRTATAEELEEWLTSMKGAYNNTDLNRVGEAINYVAGLLNENGYHNSANARTDWQIGEKPNPKQMSDYLDNLNKLKQAFPYIQSSLPNDMVNLTIKDANDIEKIFYDEIILLLGMIQNFVYSGVAGSGQNRRWQQRFRRKYNSVIPSSWSDIEYETWNDASELNWEVISYVRNPELQI